MTTFQHPFSEDTITSPYGPREAPVPGASTWHHGTDYAPPAGSWITPVANGVVVDKGWSYSAGYWVEYQANDGTYWVCCHMRTATPAILGHQIKRGQTHLGQVGDTGISGGPHLHLAASTVKGGGLSWIQTFDPAAYINSHQGALAGTPTPPPTLIPEDPDMLRFKSPTTYYFGSFDDVAEVSKDEAAAINAAVGTGRFTEVSSARAKLIIQGCRERRAKRDGLTAAAVVNMAALEASEPGGDE